MVLHRQHRTDAVADCLFNRKLSRGRVVVENAFGLLKLTFRELHLKSDLDVCILPDVITCCAILHNLLLQQSHKAVERLLEVVRIEESQHAARRQTAVLPDGDDAGNDEAEAEEG